MPRQMYRKFMFLFFIRYVRNRIDHWCTVEPGNPNPRVGISLSPLNTNDRFSLAKNLYQVPNLLLATGAALLASVVGENWGRITHDFQERMCLTGGLNLYMHHLYIEDVR